MQIEAEKRTLNLKDVRFIMDNNNFQLIHLLLAGSAGFLCVCNPAHPMHRDVEIAWGRDQLSSWLGRLPCRRRLGEMGFEA